MSATPQELIERGLAATRSDDAVVIVHASTSANLRWANNTLTTNGEMRGCSVTVIAFDRRSDGVAVGTVTSAAASVADVLALVESADAAARLAAPADDASELVRDRVSPDFAEPPVSTSIGVYEQLAPGLGEAFGTASGADRILYGFVDHDITTTYLGSTTGLRLRHVQPTGHWACTAKPGDLSQSAWVGGATRDFADVDPVAFDAELAQRLDWGQRRIELPAGRYDTVLPPTSVADLMIYLLWISGGLDAHDGQSVWSRPGGGTRVGEQVSAPSVRLRSDPNDAALAAIGFVATSTSGSESSVFDNGLEIPATDWITGGVLTSLLQSRHSARVTDLPATPVPDNLIVEIEGGSGDTDALVAGVERGLLVTSLWYIRMVDPQSALLTGLTRDGVYLVENGEVTGLVNNFRFNESPTSVLNRFTHAGATVPSFSREWGDEFTRTATPALRIGDFNMSSVLAGPLMSERPDSPDSPDTSPVVLTASVGEREVRASAAKAYELALRTVVELFASHGTEWHDGFLLMFGPVGFSLREGADSDYAVVTPNWAGDPFEDEQTDDLTLALYATVAMSSTAAHAGVEPRDCLIDRCIIAVRGWENANRLRFERTPIAREGDSGWFIEPIDQPRVEDYADEELEVVHAWEALQIRPSAIRPLGLPVGYQAMMEGDTITQVMRRADLTVLVDEPF